MKATTRTRRSTRSTTSPLVSAIKRTAVINDEDNITHTLNMAITHRTTKSSVLDFFSMAGSMRNKDEKEITNLFEQAWLEDKLLATKTLFYFRDPRGGQGERRTFRTGLRWLADVAPATVRKNLKLIAEYGRWDDLFVLFDTNVEQDMCKLIQKQLLADLVAMKKKGQSVSLLGKWMPSLNTSSAASVALARRFAKFLRWNGKKYRKTLTLLRKHIRVVERYMCEQDWKHINYETVPSRASTLYRKAFAKHDPTGYTKWLSNVKKGTAKINASVLYPYDIVDRMLSRGENDETLELQWQNLPNYMGKSVHNGLVVADTSGSMFCSRAGNVKAISVSVSLALYFAERNTGPFKGYFMTFSERPELQTVHGASLYQRVQNLSKANWGMNTNLQAVFDLVLKKAQTGKIAPKDMPAVIYIISDMEFDSCVQNKTNLQAIEQQYERAGYKRPKLVFWRVDTKSIQTPATLQTKNVALVSGCSPSILKSLLSSQMITAYDTMLEVLNGERYALITV